MTMTDVTYGVKAWALENSKSGYFARRNAYLAKTFAAKGITKSYQIRRELRKSPDFVASTTSRKSQNGLVNTLYRLINAAK